MTIESPVWKPSVAHEPLSSRMTLSPAASRTKSSWPLYAACTNCRLAMTLVATTVLLTPSVSVEPEMLAIV